MKKDAPNQYHHLPNLIQRNGVINCGRKGPVVVKKLVKNQT